jgi:hypothetical protein
MLAALSACVVSTDDQRDRNKPPTFWHDCAPHQGTCAAPFECLPVPGLNGAVCTLRCERTEQCPRWEATGHCAGSFQSSCADGICQYGCE